jgi:hypothetical protein
MAKLKLGDVVEIRTSKGLAFAQYTHQHKQYGAMLRVFRDIFQARPSNMEDLIKLHPAFICFFPLKAAVDQGIFSIVANIAVPVEAQNFPVFRAGVISPTTGKVEVWWLWDGEKEWRVDKLTAEQRQYPIRGVWNDTLLIERIEAGWTPENDPT